MALCEGMVLAWGAGDQGQLLGEFPVAFAAVPRILPILRELEGDETPVKVVAEKDRAGFLSNRGRVFLWGNGETIHEVKLPRVCCDVTLAAGETIIFTQEDFPLPAGETMEWKNRGDVRNASERLESREWYDPGGVKT